MIIGVISDTHDRLATLDTALTYFRHEGVELVIHCGDWKQLSTMEHFATHAAELELPVRGVLGNNDTAVNAFLRYNEAAPGDFLLCEGVLTLPLDDKRVLAAYHGHHEPTKRRLLADPACDILLLGHSHKPRIDQVDGKLIVNPGSTAFAIPRRRDWRPSVAVVDTATRQAQLHYYPV